MTRASLLNRAARRYDSPLRNLVTDFKAVPDGVVNPITGVVTGGTDNTDAINEAIATGQPVEIPPGTFYYAGALHTDTNGAGLKGAGSNLSFLVTDQDINYHLSVVTDTQNTQWTGFSMIGPHTTDGDVGDPYNRALVIGINPDLGDIAGDPWDASGTWVDDFVTRGYCTGLHIAVADNVRFGTVEVYEAGGASAEPGSYAVSCSGSNLYGRLVRLVNTTTRARHAVYFNGVANDCFVERVEAKGTDFAAVRNRATDGGGKRNGFGFGVFEDCNTNEQAIGSSLGGLVNFVCANDVVVVGAGGARVGDYIAIDCGGYPGPELRYMPDSVCGTVQIYGHSGDFITTHYGSHIYRSNNVRLPLLDFISGYSAAGLNDSTFRPLIVETSSYCHGGGVRTHSGMVFQDGLSFITGSNHCAPGPGSILDGTFLRGVRTVNECIDLYVPDLVVAGTYTNVVNWGAGAADQCLVDNVKVLTEPTGGLVSDASTGAQHNRVMRAPGYDMKEITTGTTVDAIGFREIRLNYSTPTTITNVIVQQGQMVKLTSANANASISHAAGGVGSVELSGAATRTFGTRSSVVFFGYITGSAGTYTWRALEATIRLTQLVNDTTTAVGLGSINLGHASDTTIARTAAGRINVEGAEVITATAVAALAAKSSPVDADIFTIWDSAAAGVPKKLTLAELKAVILALIVASAPATLDTLDELAAALGDDANFAATTTTALGLKAPLASPTFTGTPTLPAGTKGLPYDISYVQTVTTRAVGLGSNPIGVRIARACQVTSVAYRCVDADASGNLVVELRKNGAQIATSVATIAAASQTSATVVSSVNTSFAVGDILTVYITGVGTTPGTGLYADITAVTT